VDCGGFFVLCYGVSLSRIYPTPILGAWGSSNELLPACLWWAAAVGIAVRFCRGVKPIAATPARQHIRRLGLFSLPS
jgi:hypothetical protein